MLKLYLLAVLAVVIQSAQAQTKQPCANLDISYVIIADSSSSVTENPDEWTSEKTFVKNFAAQTGLGTNSRIRGGLVNYGETAVVVANCNHTAASSLTSFNSLVDGMTRQQGGTAIYHGLQRAQEVLGGNGCGRTGERQVVLLLTDGTENVETDLAKRIALENTIRAQATVHAVAVGVGTNYGDLQRLTGKDSLVRSFSSWETLAQDNATLIYLTLANEFCEVGGRWASWGAYGACSVTCGGNGIKARTRVCQNPISFQLQTDCVGYPTAGTASDVCNLGDCSGVLSQWTSYSACSETCQSNVNASPTQIRTRTCTGATGAGNCGGVLLSETRNCNPSVPCPGNWAAWTAFGTCSETCQSNILLAPIQTRSRTCNLGTFNGGCVGSATESQSCNAAVTCPGTLSAWSSYGTCSATCQLGIFAPTQTRTRACIGNTFGGNCNSATLSEPRDCNVELMCPGDLSQWSVYSACSENCQSNVNAPPTQTRTRACTNVSFNGNCGGAALSQTQNCNVAIPCTGNWGQWSAYGACSETCHSNVNASPFQTRTRSCSGETFGGGCSGISTENLNCNTNVPCPGTLSAWSSYGVCSATCQLGIFAPKQTRTRACTGSTFGGNCIGATLSEPRDCNVEFTCPGTLSLWSTWSTCPTTCQTGVTAPIQSRSRTCTGTSFGGNCNGASLSGTQKCVENVPCPGVLSAWTVFGACSATCNPTTGVATQTRTRSCQLPTLGGNCNNVPLIDSRTCNADVGCPGTLSAWGPWSDCSKTCQDDVNQPGGQSRIRFCSGSTLNNNCNNAFLREDRSCSLGVICPVSAQWNPWGLYSACSATCGQGTKVRTRTCTRSLPYGFYCTGSANETAACQIFECPKVCEINKRCSCSSVKQYTTPPVINEFNITMTEIENAVYVMSYWTEAIQKYACESCSVTRLQSSVSMVNGQIATVNGIKARLSAIKENLRGVVNCHSNLSVTSELWKLYDFIWRRCVMLDGITIELSSVKLRFDAALTACNQYGWFHQFLKHMTRKFSI